KQATPKISPSPPSRWRVPLWLMGVAGGLAALVLAGIVIIVNSEHGSIKIELSDPKANAKVEVDGDTIELNVLGKPLRLKLGDHKLRVTGEDFDIDAPESFTVKRWGNPVVQVKLTPKVARKHNPPDRNEKHIKNSIGMELVLIPPGKFLMGSHEGEGG